MEIWWTDTDSAAGRSRSNRIETGDSLEVFPRVAKGFGVGQDNRKFCRHDERLVSFARCRESENPLGRACSSSWNRLVRTRMLGGVGRTVSNGRPYPISPMSLGLTDRIHA